MAVTQQDVLNFISENVTEKRKMVPTKDIVAHLGTEALAVIKTLKENGTLLASRGRYGGVKPAGTVNVSEETAPSQEADASTEQDDVTSQFAELMAKLDTIESADEQQLAVG